MKGEKNKVSEKILKAVGGSAVLAKLLEGRGIDEEEVPVFLNPDLYRPTAPEEFPGMEKAVKIVRKAIQQGKKICIYGDYDVDGVTATALLLKTLKKLGAKVFYKVPDRFKEGYGMKEEVISNLYEKGIELIISCDCGIANVKEIELAKELGMEVVVTDHHTLPPALPKADAVVNPHFLDEGHPARWLPGVGVAYFLAKGLLKSIKREAEAEEFLDLVTLGIIADAVVLRGENRYIAQRGIPLIRECQNPGIRALVEVAGIDPKYITEEDIGFQICPRINAAGRLEHAGIAVELFLSDDAQRARNFAKKLDELNEERRLLVDAMLEEAEAMVEEGEPILLFRPHWHQGILGITAGRLCEKYKVPAIMMSLKEDGVTVVGSARSVEGLNIYEALLECRSYLAGFGGHAGAAGINLERKKLDSFIKNCSKVIKEKMRDVKAASDDYDLKLPLEDVDEKLYFELRKLAPFGEGWPEPIFYCPGVEIINARPMTNQRHLRLVVGSGDKNLPALWWWAEDTPERCTADLLYSVGINRWNGKEEAQLIVRGILKTGEKEEEQKEVKKEPQWVDYRSWRKLGKQEPIYEDALYFYEGPPLRNFPEETVNRYGIKETHRLVLLSCPPEQQVLDEIIALSKAKEVIMAFSPEEIVESRVIIRRVMEYIKFAAIKKGGHTSVQDIAAAAAQTELAVMEILHFLEKQQMLDVKTGEYGRLKLKLIPRKAAKAKLPATLKQLLEETNAYRRHMNYHTRIHCKH